MLKVLLISITIIFIGCSDSLKKTKDFSDGADLNKRENARPAYSEDRNVFFGDLHVHTKHSFDAYIFGTTATPDDAYRFARGEAIKHPLGFDQQLREPLDFYAVTDHGFFMGMVPGWADVGSKASRLPGADHFHNLNAEGNVNLDSIPQRVGAFRNMVRTLTDYDIIGVINAWRTNNLSQSSDMYDHGTHLAAWADVARSAEENYEPGKLTTFIAYEYTSSMANSENLHRNVIFEGSKAPTRPFSRIDSINPEDLWTWMDMLRDEKGIDSIAIPHNSNGSNGQMFEDEKWNGEVVDKEYAAFRMRNEPLVEVTQVKGTSETHPLLSPNDEWANFEIFPSRIGQNIYSIPYGGYVRDAYLRGMLAEWEGKGNPYKFGLVGASDTHTAASSFDESNYWSKVGLLDGETWLRGSTPLAKEDIDQITSSVNTQGLYRFVEQDEEYFLDTYYSRWGASGIAAVWAEENTRESIFAGFRRKETYATSGSRIKLRFFGGFGLDELDLDDDGVIAKAYEKGVSMGGDLAYNKDEKPSFIVWAQRDKNGAPLQRIQIIKGTVDEFDAMPNEEVIDVVCSNGLKVNPKTNRCPDNGAKVDIETCAFSMDRGAAELKTIWTDENYDPTQKNFYYVRVLENPTCRWSTWDAIKSGSTIRKDLETLIQERAWSTPIWISSVRLEQAALFSTDDTVLDND